MENWGIQMLAWIGAFILGVAVNLATPTIKTFFDKSSLSFRNKYINNIKSEYFKIRSYRTDYANLVVRLLKLFAYLILSSYWSVTLLIFTVLAIIKNDKGESDLFTQIFLFTCLGLAGSFSGATSGVGIGIVELINKVIRFDVYREKTIAKLKKLGSNPELLDKEETAGG